MATDTTRQANLLSPSRRVRFEENVVVIRSYGTTEEAIVMEALRSSEKVSKSRPLLLIAYAVLSICLTLSFKRVFGIVAYPCSLMAFLLAMEALVIHTTLCLNHMCCASNNEPQKKTSLPSEREEENSMVSQQLLLVMVSICVALELGLSNEGLARMSVASHTMIRSCTPLFVLMASLILGLEVLSFRIFVIVALISTGTLLCSIGRAPSHIVTDQDSSSALSSRASMTAQNRTQLTGVLLTISSGFAAGMRWGLTQLLTQVRGAKPQLLVATTLPIAAFTLSLFAAIIELPIMLRRGEADFTRLLDRVAIYAIGLASLGLCLLYTEVCLVATTSSLSLAILATAKETLLVAISIFGLHETITGLSASGFLVTIIGILAYQFHKHRPHAGLKDLATMRTTSYLQLSTTELEAICDGDDHDNNIEEDDDIVLVNNNYEEETGDSTPTRQRRRDNDNAPILLELASQSSSSLPLPLPLPLPPKPSGYSDTPTQFASAVNDVTTC